MPEAEAPQQPPEDQIGPKSDALPPTEAEDPQKLDEAHAADIEEAPPVVAGSNEGDVQEATEKAAEAVEHAAEAMENLSEAMGGAPVDPTAAKMADLRHHLTEAMTTGRTIDCPEAREATQLAAQALSRLPD